MWKCIYTLHRKCVLQFVHLSITDRCRVLAGSTCWQNGLRIGGLWFKSNALCHLQHHEALILAWTHGIAPSSDQKWTHRLWVLQRPLEVPAVNDNTVTAPVTSLCQHMVVTSQNANLLQRMNLHKLRWVQPHCVYEQISFYIWDLCCWATPLLHGCKDKHICPFFVW